PFSGGFPTHLPFVPASFKRQRRYCGNRGAPPARKSLGGHLGVNIFARVHRKASRSNVRKLALLPLKSEQPPLFGPVGGEFERQPRQALRAELRRLFAVDDGRD